MDYLLSPRLYNRGIPFQSRLEEESQTEQERFMKLKAWFKKTSTNTTINLSKETNRIEFDIHEVPRLCEQLLTFYMKNGGNVLSALTLRSEITRLIQEHNEREVEDLKRFSIALPTFYETDDKRSITPPMLYSQPIDAVDHYYNSIGGKTSPPL